MLFTLGAASEMSSAGRAISRDRGQPGARTDKSGFRFSRVSLARAVAGPGPRGRSLIRSLVPLRRSEMLCGPSPCSRSDLIEPRPSPRSSLACETPRLDRPPLTGAYDHARSSVGSRDRGSEAASSAAGISNGGQDGYNDKLGSRVLLADSVFNYIGAAEKLSIEKSWKLQVRARGDRWAASRAGALTRFRGLRLCRRASSCSTKSSSSASTPCTRCGGTKSPGTTPSAAGRCASKATAGPRCLATPRSW